MKTDTKIGIVLMTPFSLVFFFTLGKVLLTFSAVAWLYVGLAASGVAFVAGFIVIVNTWVEK